MTNNVGLICCYGFAGQQYGRSKLEVYGISCYIYDVLTFSLNHKANLLIFCGGKTRPDYPEISESQTILDEFYSRIVWTYNISTQILLEETSTTTHGNIVNGFNKLVRGVNDQTIEFDFTSDTIYIFCDTYREWKVKVISWILFRGMKVNYKIVPCKRKNIHPKSSLLYQSTIGIASTLKNKSFREGVYKTRLMCSLAFNLIK